MPRRLKIERKTVPITDVRLNYWNYNVQDTDMFQKEVRSIQEHGYVDTILCREWPMDRMDDDQKALLVKRYEGTELTIPPDSAPFEVIGGEHRLRAMMSLGETEIEIDAVTLEETGESPDDSQSKELSVLLNEIKGKPDFLKLAEIVTDLVIENEEEAKFRLPFTEVEIKGMQTAMKIEPDPESTGGSGGDDGDGNGDKDIIPQVRITIKCPADKWEKWKHYFDQIAVKTKMEVAYKNVPDGKEPSDGEEEK